ncbi:MAG: hypothetical protein K5894_10935 [Lachnospiraceae bacterium]|nr:hypothetical protein [Lachnospiraceae bacterium]
MIDSLQFENKLRLLFDYQKFENNSNLAEVIEESINTKNVFELEDEDIEEVFAAGNIITPDVLPDEEDGNNNHGILGKNKF